METAPLKVGTILNVNFENVVGAVPCRVISLTKRILTTEVLVDYKGQAWRVVQGVDCKWYPFGAH